MFVQQLGKCKDIESVHKFCKTLDSKNVQFNGRAFVNVQTGDILDFTKLTNKIIDLYNKHSSIESEETKTAEDTAALLFDLKAITSSQSKSAAVFMNAFGEHSSIEKLAKHCKDTVRQNDEVMQTIVKNYNLLAGEVNQGLKGNTVVLDNVTKEQLSQSINRLNFLNQFLGVKWNKGHFEGSSAIPLCDTGEVLKAPAPKSFQPKDCESLSEMYGLINLIRENPSIVRDGKTIEIPGEAKISIKEFEEQLLKLFQEDMKREPYAKSDLYIQFTAIVFSLNKVAHRSTESINKGVMEAFHQCVEGIKNDPKSMERVQKQYNSLTGKINEELTYAVRASRDVASSMTRGSFFGNRDGAIQTMEHIEFLNLFAGFKLDTEHFEGKAFFPRFYDVKNPIERAQAQSRYNYYAMMFNYELGTVARHERLEELRKQIDPTNLTSLMLDEVEVAAINEEIGQLESYTELTAPPLPKRFTQHMLTEQCRLADLLEISLSKDQQKGLEPFPVYGREIPLPTETHQTPEVAMPWRFEQYNIIAGQINAQLEYIDKGLDYLELHRKFNEKDMIEGWNDFDEIYPVLEQTRKDWKSVEKEHKYFFNNDRLAHERLSSLLMHVERSGIVTLTKAQKQGKEPLPIINIDKLPFPGREAVLKELEQIPKEKWSKAYNSWPESWRKEMEELRDLTDKWA